MCDWDLGLEFGLGGHLTVAWAMGVAVPGIMGDFLSMQVGSHVGFRRVLDAFLTHVLDKNLM